MQTLNTVNFRQVRDMGEVINTTFAFVRKEFKPLAKATLIVAGPMIVLTGIINGFYQIAVTTKQGAPSIIGTGALMILSAIICVTLVSAVVYHYMQLYTERGEGNIAPEEIWQSGKKDLVGLVVTALLSSLLIVFASVFFIIPGIYLAGVLSICYVVKVQEKLGFWDNFKRCRQLVANNWWSTFGMMLVMYMIISVLALVFTVPTIVVSFMSGLHSANPEEFSGVPGGNITLLLTSAISTIGTYLLYVPLFVAMGLQYFSLVEKKEAVGLLDRLETLGATDSKADDKEDF